jgi:lipoate-protein ligase A
MRAAGQGPAMTALADREWRLVPTLAEPGPLQMALDEVAAETAAAGGPRTVRVYDWAPGSLTLGYHQDPATIDWAYCERADIPVTRRQTGGGAIYHDGYGDIAYSVVAPADELPEGLLPTYERLCEPLFAALAAVGVDARLAETERPASHAPACYLRAVSPAHDVVAADGRKLSGNAQYRRRDAVVQHGSLSYARATERHLGVFTDPPDAETFESRVTSVREQTGVGGDPVVRETVVSAFEDALADWADAGVRGFTAAERERARDLVETKYDADAWVRERTPPESA